MLTYLSIKVNFRIFLVPEQNSLILGFKSPYTRKYP